MSFISKLASKVGMTIYTCPNCGEHTLIESKKKPKKLLCQKCNQVMKKEE